MPGRSRKGSSVATTQERNRKVVRDLFRLISRGKQMDGLRYFTEDCVQHNPYVRGGMKELFQAMAAVQQDTPKFSDPYLGVKRVLADGDTVAVHTVLLSSKSRPGEGGLRQVHLFRFGKEGKIDEYWDVTQMVGPEMPNAANAFGERGNL